MKTFLSVIALTLFIYVSVSAQPGIKFKDTRHEFGSVPEGSYPTWVFKFVNTGNQELKLTDVKASCGCTSPQWSRDPIKPGDSGEVKVVFNSAGYAGRQFAKSVTITTNITENNQPKQEFLFIQGNVAAKIPEIPQYPVKFTELKHDLGTLKPGKKMIWPILILNEGDSTITVKEINSTCSCITFQKGIVTVPPHQTVGFNATIKTKGISPKTLNETIKLVTNLPVNTTKRISEKGYLVTVTITDNKKK
jgi:hypothetical protein